MGLRRTYILVLAWVANTEPRNTQLQRDRSPDSHVIQQMAGQSNPWAETDLLTGIKLGCPENGLVMARQFSLQRVGSNDVRTLRALVCCSFPLSLPELQSALPRSGSTVSNYPMSRYLEAVRKTSDLRNALNEVR